MNTNNIHYPARISNNFSYQHSVQVQGNHPWGSSMDRLDYPRSGWRSQTFPTCTMCNCRDTSGVRDDYYLYYNPIQTNISHQSDTVCCANTGQNWTTVVENDGEKTYLENCGNSNITFPDNITRPWQTNSCCSETPDANKFANYSLNDNNSSANESIINIEKHSWDFQRKWPCGGTVSVTAANDISIPDTENQLPTENRIRATISPKASTVRNNFDVEQMQPIDQLAHVMGNDSSQGNETTTENISNGKKIEKVPTRKACTKKSEKSTSSSNEITVSIAGVGQLFKIPIVVARPPKIRNTRKRKRQKNRPRKTSTNKKKSKIVTSKSPELDMVQNSVQSSANAQSSSSLPSLIEQTCHHDNEQPIMKDDKIKDKVKKKSATSRLSALKVTKKRKRNKTIRTKKEMKMRGKISRKVVTRPIKNDTQIIKAYRNVPSLDPDQNGDDATPSIIVASSPHTYEDSSSSHDDDDDDGGGGFEQGKERKSPEMDVQTPKDGFSANASEIEKSNECREAAITERNKGEIRDGETDDVLLVPQGQEEKFDLEEESKKGESEERDESQIRSEKFYDDDDLSDVDAEIDLADETTLNKDVHVEEMLSEFIINCPMLSPWYSEDTEESSDIDIIDLESGMEESNSKCNVMEEVPIKQNSNKDKQIVEAPESMEIDQQPPVNDNVLHTAVGKADKEMYDWRHGRLGPFAHLQCLCSLSLKPPSAFENPFDFVTRAKTEITQKSLRTKNLQLQEPSVNDISFSKNSNKKVSDFENIHLKEKMVKAKCTIAEDNLSSNVNQKIVKEVGEGQKIKVPQQEKEQENKKKQINRSRTKTNLLKAHSRIWTTDYNRILPPAKRKIHEDLNKVFLLGKDGCQTRPLLKSTMVEHKRRQNETS